MPAVVWFVRSPRLGVVLLSVVVLGMFKCRLVSHFMRVERSVINCFLMWTHPEPGIHRLAIMYGLTDCICKLWVVFVSYYVADGSCPLSTRCCSVKAKRLFFSLMIVEILFTMSNFLCVTRSQICFLWHGAVVLWMFYKMWDDFHSFLVWLWSWVLLKPVYLHPICSIYQCTQIPTA